MAELRAARFRGDDVLASCLTGHTISQGSGAPAESVTRIQQALADLGFTVAVDGIFGPETGQGVTAYKAGKGLAPTTPVVGPGAMGALDDDFAHELLDAAAARLGGTPFDPGPRTSPRAEVGEELAVCSFGSSVGVEVGHSAAFVLPATVASTWSSAGGAGGPFGRPAGDPFVLDATRSAQEFDKVVVVFEAAGTFPVARSFWAVATAAKALVGFPTGAAGSIPGTGATAVPFDTGVVVAAGGFGPQALRQAVFDAWRTRETGPTPLGPPVGLGFPTVDGIVFPFRFGRLALASNGSVS